MIAVRQALLLLGISWLTVSPAFGQLALLPAEPSIPTAAIPLEESTCPAPEPRRADWAFAPPPGWFVTVDLAAVWTLIDLGVYGPEPPALNKLDWTVLPRAEVGYRFESGEAVRFEYRFLDDPAKANTNVGEPTTEDRISFTAQAFTMDYQSRVYGPPCWAAFQWEAGVRIACLDFSVRDHWADGLPLAEHSRQALVAAGPHLALKPAIQLGDTGFTAFIRIEGDSLVGLDTTRLQATSTYASGWPGMAPRTTTSSVEWHALAAALEVGWEVGVGYTPPSMPRLRLAGGYQGDAIFWIGRSFTEQGPFVRLGIGF